MIVYASTLHVAWAVLIWWDNAATGSTTLASIADTFGFITPWLCLSVAITACAAFWVGRPLYRFLLMIPQQVLLVFSAVGAAGAIWHSSYADGELRPMAFIASDQMWAIVAVVCYSLAVVFTASDSNHG